MLKQMRSFLVIVQFEWILTKPVEQSSRDTFLISEPFIPLLFMDVFRVLVLKDTTCIMMPTGNRFCLYSSWCSFEVFQMKGTKEALTVWHCFYCFSVLYKQKMYFNFSHISIMINQAVFNLCWVTFCRLLGVWEQRISRVLLENTQHI